MEKPLAASDGGRSRGNPNWGKPLPPIPTLLTEFEIEVEHLRLRRSQYVAPAELKRWCDHNRNRVYVPEWLLAKWGMQVEARWVDVA